MYVGLQIPSFKYPGGTAAIRPKLKEIVTTVRVIALTAKEMATTARVRAITTRVIVTTAMVKAITVTVFCFFPELLSLL